jgi:cellobiose phosphorylase
MLLIDGKQFVPATARHGQGYSAFDAEYDRYRVMVRLFVSSEQMEKYYQIKIANKGDEPLEMKIDMVYKLVLGVNEEQTARYLHSEWQEEENSLWVRNVYHETYRNTRVQLTSTEKLTEVSLESPNRKRLGTQVTVPPHSEKELAYVIAVHDDNTATPRMVTLPMIEEEYEKVGRFWDERLGVVQVETPDRAFNYMLNRWYLYQVYAARLFARAGFYQVGGATGYRDQLQDVMSCLYSDPAYARKQILDHAAHQFAEGDVLHWWHENMKMGARTTFSDDYLWLVYVTYQYVHVTGDNSILSETVAFCQADQLNAGESERCVRYALPAQPVATDDNRDSNFEYATLYEHLRRSINRAMHRIGIHGLPLMGCGDWNDGMSLVGVEGKGESVWVAFFLVDVLPKMEELTQLMLGADLSYCSDLADFRSRLVTAIQTSAWDGAWFLRAYFDNGDPMGSRNNTECQIDLISQAWSIITGVATQEQKESIFRETDYRLVNREHEIIQLLTPAFQHSQNNPGYIMRYPIGVRENGGQYTHGAMWYIMAQLKEGRTDMAYFLYSLINPIHRTMTLADVLKYKVEPYCIAADIYSNPQHPGRGGWTWYTGSASWAYKTGIENILGLHKEGDTLIIDPCIPSEWEQFSITYRYGGTPYYITYRRNKNAQATTPASITLVDDGMPHEITI